MIISHKHKFIFIKCGKTASTSLELALHKFCGPDDIVPPTVTRDSDEHIKEQEREYYQLYPHYQPKNYYTPFKYYRWPEWKKLLFTGYRDVYYNHMSAAEIIQRIDIDCWNEYYKFCFTRNPWETVVTGYYFKKMQLQNPDLSLDEYLVPAKLAALTKRTYLLYTINDHVMVDQVYQYENLQESLLDIEQRLQLPGPIEMEPVNVNREKNITRKDLFNDKQVQLIANVFHREIELFNYHY